MFERFASWTVRRRLWVLLATLALTLVFVSQIANLRIVIDPAKALPQQHPYVQGTNVAERAFGTKYTVVVAIAPASGDIYRPEVLERVERITRALATVSGVKAQTLLSLSASRAKNIQGGTDEMSVTPLMPAVPASAEAMAALRRAIADNPTYIDTVVARDGRATAITVTVEMGAFGFRGTMDRIHEIARQETTPEIAVSVSGIPMYLGQLEIYSERMLYLFPIALLVVGLLHFEAFRTFQGFVLPLVTALLSVVWGLGMMGFARVPMDAFNAVTPILILAVTAGHAVQLLKRYYEEYDIRLAAGMEPVAASTAAVVASVARVGPVMVTAGGVAVAGFFSLVTFDIATIRNFGIFTGLGILSGLAIEMTFIPAVRSWLKPPKPHANDERWSPWTWAIGHVTRWTTGADRRPVYASVTLAAALMALGIAHVSLENSTKSYFAPDLWFQQEDRLINQRTGGANTFYVIFEGAEDDAVKDPAMLKLMADTQRFLDAQPGIGKTVSIADFIMRMNQAMNAGDPAFHRIPDQRDLISQYLLLYSMSGEPGDFDAYVDYGYRTAGITAWVKSDASSYIADLIARVNDFLEARTDRRVTVRIGGSVPETAALSQVLVESKLKNVAQMGVVVTTVSALVFRSLVAGLLVMAPLLVTVIVNFGFMGLTGMPLNTPNSISSAMAIGIGADYAIYLLYRIREELQNTDRLDEALRAALASAGKAVLYVGSAIAGGYGVLLFSFGFNVHIWFGTLIVLSMIVSVTSALLIVPALLMTFRPRFMGGPAFRPVRVGTAAAVLLAVAAALAARPGTARADAAADVMARNYAVTRFDDSIGEATMRLINRNGDQRVRRIFSATRLSENGIDNKRSTRFLSPADIRNTVVLMLEQSGHDDDLFIFLPAMKKVRRLSAANKKDSFVGTDLSYGDVIGYRVSEWTHRILREESIDGIPCDVVESLPAMPKAQAESGYAKRVTWVRRDNGIAAKGESYDVNGRLLKVATFGKPLQVDAAKDRWQPMLIDVTNVQTGHRTVMEWEIVKANQGVGEEFFTTRYMEKEQ